jgi:hypothetical protein
VLTVPAVTGNVVEVDPCGIVTEAGTFTAAEDALTATVVLLSAAEVSATVQVEPTEGVKEVGVHVIPLKTGVCRIVTVPPLTAVGIAAPVELADRPFVSWTDEDASCVEPARFNVTVAKTLLGIVTVLRPQTKQVAVPTPLVQESDLFAAADPASIVAEVKSVVE